MSQQRHAVPAAPTPSAGRNARANAAPYSGKALVVHVVNPSGSVDEVPSFSTSSMSDRVPMLADRAHAQGDSSAMVVQQYGLQTQGGYRDYGYGTSSPSGPSGGPAFQGPPNLTQQNYDVRVQQNLHRNVNVA